MQHLKNLAKSFNTYILTTFKSGGIVNESLNNMDEIILPPALQYKGSRHFKLKKDGNLTVVPSDGDKIDVGQIGSVGDAIYFRMPKIDLEALTPTETPIQLIKRMMLENKQIKKLILQAVNDLDSEKYKECVLRYEANERYIKTATEDLKRITF